jgi:hypothetical protein
MSLIVFPTATRVLHPRSFTACRHFHPLARKGGGTAKISRINNNATGTAMAMGTF